jgi:hypothetical protein
MEGSSGGSARGGPEKSFWRRPAAALYRGPAGRIEPRRRPPFAGEARAARAQSFARARVWGPAMWGKGWWGAAGGGVGGTHRPENPERARPSAAARPCAAAAATASPMRAPGCCSAVRCVHGAVLHVLTAAGEGRGGAGARVGGVGHPSRPAAAAAALWEPWRLHARPRTAAALLHVPVLLTRGVWWRAPGTAAGGGGGGGGGGSATGLRNRGFQRPFAKRARPPRRSAARAAAQCSC